MPERHIRWHKGYLLVAAALLLGLAAVPLLSAGELPATAAPVQPASEERAADLPAALPSVRGVIGPHQSDLFSARRPQPMKGSGDRYDQFFAEETATSAVDPSLRYLSSEDGYLQKQAIAVTTMSKRLRKDILVYTVEEGDNVSTLAERFDITTDSIVWANDDLEFDPDFIVIGQKLNILPIPGVLHTVKAGDTLESIAKTYKADAEAIAEYDYNNLKPPYTLTAGQKIIVPDGEKPYNPRVVTLPDGRQVLVGAPKGLGRFVWPAQGYITTRFGEWQQGVAHRGIDIGGWMGEPIYAADAGVVTYSGPLGGYGLAVLIDHGNGFQTLYGHFSVYYPKLGQSVKRGQAIGKMGSTGNSTGPHLHFEITLWGGLVNPMNYLP
jgi:murein DD-endopeptidase MepM/ murein hydrolase activator NlpD